MSDIANFNIQFKSSAAKEFRNLPQEIKNKVVSKIDSLSSNPLPKEVKKLKEKTTFIDYELVYIELCMNFTKMIR